MIAKRNGFSCPPHILQAVTWLAGGFEVAASYAVVYPLLRSSSALAFLCLFSVFLLISLLFGVITTASDPTDPVVYEHRESIEKGTPFDERKYSFLCTSCQTNVSETSKHCAQCNRCVAHFDHHCKWLNNCIGGSNYRWFMCLIWAVECLQTITLVFSLVALLDSISDVATASAGVSLAVLIGLLAESAVVLFINLQLILFHVWLRLRGMTTYEYIRGRRKMRVRNVIDKSTTERKEPPPPLSVISTLQDDFKPVISAQHEEYNLAAELRPVSEEESSYSVSESVVSGSRASRPVSSRNELL